MSGSRTAFFRGENPLRADKLNTAFSERVLRSGDTMQGMFTLWRDPVNAFDAATKQYVDTVATSGVVGGTYLPLTGGTLTGPVYFNAAVVFNGSINTPNLSTSSVGLPPGTWWNNGGFVCIVP